jgi:tyrosinase
MCVPSRYWDEARDAGNFKASDVLDPITGFGGNGVGLKGCIVDGPFANYTNSLGPGYKIGDNCIYRFINDTLSKMAGREYIDACYRRTNFVDFWTCAEMAPHNGGHAGIGGKVIPPSTIT